MRISYRRTSTINQTGERFKLDKSYYDLILFDKGVSGKIPFNERERGKELINLVNEGNVTELVVEELSRLGRNTIDVLLTLQYLEEHNVNVVVRNMGNLQSRVNGKKNPVWNLITSVMSSLYEMERENILERTEMGRKMYVLNGGKLKIKFHETIEHLNKEIERLEAELKVYSNSKGWVNWIENMAKGLDKVKSSSNESKKVFLNKHIREIEVVYDDKIKSHRLDIRFKYPIVGDIFQYAKSGEKDNKGFKKYEISDGSTNKVLEMPLVNYRKKQNEKERSKLNDLIIELREKKGFSLQQICNDLNGMNLKTPTKKKWDKPKLSSYYKNLKEQIPKK